MKSPASLTGWDYDYRRCGVHVKKHKSGIGKFRIKVNGKEEELMFL